MLHTWLSPPILREVTECMARLVQLKSNCNSWQLVHDKRSLDMMSVTLCRANDGLTLIGYHSNHSEDEY